jgi:hypothetical protein
MIMYSCVTRSEAFIFDVNFILLVALRPNGGHSLLIHDVSRSHTDTPQSVGLLWTSDQPVEETSP